MDVPWNRSRAIIGAISYASNPHINDNDDDDDDDDDRAMVIDLSHGYMIGQRSTHSNLISPICAPN